MIAHADNLLDLPSALNNLSLNTKLPNSSTPTSKTKQKQPIAESWDAESDPESNSSSDNDQLSALPSTTKSKSQATISDYPSAPPPTPAQAQSKHFSRPAPMEDFTQFEAPHAALASASTRAPPRQRDPNVRPETTMSSASRLIAGALGVRAPKGTEEQRQYDKAVREKEQKRRDREKEDKKKEEEERIRARAAVWDD